MIGLFYFRSNEHSYCIKVLLVKCGGGGPYNLYLIIAKNIVNGFLSFALINVVLLSSIYRSP